LKLTITKLIITKYTATKIKKILSYCDIIIQLTTPKLLILTTYFDHLFKDRKEQTIATDYTVYKIYN
jgi:hypothetical protein